MRGLVDAGLIRFAGLSNVNLTMVKRCLSVGPVDAVQNQLSLLHRDDDNSFLRWLQERGVGYVAYGSLAFGLLTGAIDSRTRFDPQDWRSGAPARYETNYYEALFAPDRLRRHVALVHDLAGLAETSALPLGTLALRWVLERPGVTAALIGSLEPAHIRTNALAGEVRLDSSTRDRIKEVLERHE
jgi:aryl-alcohol dehydrogenase-like predicted oxidoreductase